MPRARSFVVGFAVIAWAFGATHSSGAQPPAEAGQPVAEPKRGAESPGRGPEQGSGEDSGAAAELELARSLVELGSQARDRSALDLAEEHFRRALEIRRRLDPESLAVAECLNSLGIVEYQRGRLDAAETLYRQALELRLRLAPQSHDVMGSYNNLGIVSYRRGDEAEAEKLLAKALEIQRRLDPESLAMAAALGNLAVLATRRGELDRAEELFTEVLELRRRLAPGGLEVATALNNLGVVHLDRGNLEQAEALQRQALEIRERLDPEGGTVAHGLLNLGNILARRGDFEGAEECYRRSVAIEERLAPESLRLATALIALGDLALQRGEHPTAETIFERARAITTREGRESYEHSLVLHNLSEVALARADLDRAEALLLDALAIKERRSPEGSASLALTLRQLGELALRRNDLDRAGPWLDRALAMASELVPGSLDEAEAAAGLATVRQRAGHTEEALALRRRSITALESQSRRLGGSHDLRTRFAARHGAIYRDALALLLASGREVEAFDLLERYRARVFLTLLAERDLRPVSDHVLETLDLAGVRRVLDPGTLLLSYAVGERESVLFAVGPGAEDFAVHRLAVGEVELERQVERLRRNIETLAEERILALPLERLGALLLAPVAEAIGRAERLLVLVDGALHFLPFALLPRPAAAGGFEPLIATHPVTLAASATVFAELAGRRKPQRPNSLLALGDPSCVRRSEAQGPCLAPLPASRREVEQIALFFEGRAKILLGHQAREETLEALAPRASILHLACHGTIDLLHPLDSALVLARAEGVGEGRDDGLLRVWEIFEGWHLEAELVTLSACRSGLGAPRGGEGLMGLTRAFQFAGARSVLASLWSISDVRTAELMRRFYAALADGVTKDEALRQAQLALREAPVVVEGAGGETTLNASHPFYWAGFQLFGDWR